MKSLLIHFVAECFTYTLECMSGILIARYIIWKSEIDGMKRIIDAFTRSSAFPSFDNPNTNKDKPENVYELRKDKE